MVDTAAKAIQGNEKYQSLNEKIGILFSDEGLGKLFNMTRTIDESLESSGFGRQDLADSTSEIGSIVDDILLGVGELGVGENEAVGKLAGAKDVLFAKLAMKVEELIRKYGSE